MWAMLLTRRGYDDSIVVGKRYGVEEMEQWESLGNKKRGRAYSQVQVVCKQVQPGSSARRSQQSGGASWLSGQPHSRTACKLVREAPRSSSILHGV